MFSRTVSLVVIILFFAACGTAFAGSTTDKRGANPPVVMQGRVTAVRGNLVTVKDAKGVERHYELASAAGVKVGQNTWCEEDCGRGMRIGDKNVQVKTAR